MGNSTAAQKFRDGIESKQSAIDDYDPEKELWTGGYSGKAMAGTWILIGLASIGLVAVAFLLPPLSLIGIPVIWAIGGLVYAWRRMGVHYQLTSQRFIHQVGILTRKTDRIEVIDLDDVSFTQGPVQRIFGVGTIVLTGSDRTHPTLAMIGIADVKEVAGLIDDVRRQERRRRSLHIESI
ncbi:MAG: PH domain-containing protein [Planctomycetota bacterium]|nr:PH domain-containing protein [Planctomycetota bacterium]